MAIYRNIVAAANPLTEREEAAALLEQAAPGRRLVAWRRDWSSSTERRLLWRPFGPRPGEVLDELDVVTVRGELDTAFFCVQSAAGIGEVGIGV